MGFSVLCASFLKISNWYSSVGDSSDIYKNSVLNNPQPSVPLFKDTSNSSKLEILLQTLTYLLFFVLTILVSKNSFWDAFNDFLYELTVSPSGFIINFSWSQSRIQSKLLFFNSWKSNELQII